MERRNFLKALFGGSAALFLPKFIDESPWEYRSIISPTTIGVDLCNRDEIDSTIVNYFKISDKMYATIPVGLTSFDQQLAFTNKMINKYSKALERDFQKQIIDLCPPILWKEYNTTWHPKMVVMNH